VDLFFFDDSTRNAIRARCGSFRWQDAGGAVLLFFGLWWGGFCKLCDGGIFVLRWPYEHDARSAGKRGEGADKACLRYALLLGVHHFDEGLQGVRLPPRHAAIQE